MESKGEEPVVVGEVGVSEFKMDLPEMWLYVTFIVDYDRCHKINIEILEAELDWAAIWNPN
jgi:hypothetical protein